MAVELTPEFIDNVVKKMNAAVDSLLCATGTVQRAKAEIELLQQVELAQKFMIAILWESTDRSSLQEIFGGDLARVCRVRAVLEQLQLEKLSTGGQRLSQCLLACQSIQDVLADLGFANALRKMQEEQSKAMASRFAGKPEEDVTTVEKKPDSPDAEPAGESKELEPTKNKADLQVSENAAAQQEDVQERVAHGPRSPEFLVDAELAEDSDESHGTPPDDGQEGKSFSSLSSKISDISSGLVATAGYALCGVRTKASELAESAERQFGFLRNKSKDAGEVAESIIVEVVRVADLGASEHRLGDLAASLAQGVVGKKRPRRVYVSLQLGKNKVRTSARRLLEDNLNGEFASRHLLDLTANDRILKVQVFDKRRVQSVLRGDPMIGEGTLEFEAVIGSGILEGEVKLKRAAMSMGQVFLKYKFMEFKWWTWFRFVGGLSCRLQFAKSAGSTGEIEFQQQEPNLSFIWA